MPKVDISQLIYDPSKGRDVMHHCEIDFDPAKHKTKEEAAKALGEALVKYAVNVEGYTKELARSEISVWSPDRTEQYSGTRAWCVVWESGPYEWAIPMSMQMQGPWGFCEPYYSFDLHFTD